MRKIQNVNRHSNDDNDNTGPLFTVRWSWLLGTFALMIVLGATLVIVYYYQTKDQTEFRIQAFRHEEEAGRWRQGIPQLRLYHDEKPNDMAVVRELAEAYDRNGTIVSDWKYAAEYYQNLCSHISSETERLAILERILDNQRKAADIKTMLPTIQRVLEMAPENPLAWKCMVIVRTPMLSTGVYQPTTDEPETYDLLMQKAMEVSPSDAELVSAYCRLLRSIKPNTLKCVSQDFRNTPLETRTQEADRIMADFAKANADSPAAILADYEYRRQYRLLDPAAEELDEALVKVQELDPNSPELLLYTGMFYEQKALRLKSRLTKEEYEIQRQDAIDLFEQTVEASPLNPAGYLQLAAVYRLDEERNKQIEILEKANQRMRSSNLGIMLGLVSAYLENGDTTNADKMTRLIRDWLDRNRLTLSKEDMTNLRFLTSLLEGQSLAIGLHPTEALAKFKSVLEPSIPPLVDSGTVYSSLMMYAQLLNDTLNLDSAVGVFERTIRYLETETGENDLLIFSRMDRVYVSLIGALHRLGQTEKAKVKLDYYVQYLRKTLEQQPINQMIRLTLASALVQQTMNQPEDNRDWSELNTILDILRDHREGIMPSWRVDFLRASVKWEEIGHSYASVDEVLIPLRLAENHVLENSRVNHPIGENQVNNDLLFLIQLENAYHTYGSQVDSDRVLEYIHSFENQEGLPVWYLIKAVRAEQNGNLLEAKKLMDEAVTTLPESRKGLFLSIQETLASDIDQNDRSIVRERQTLVRLREINENHPTIPSLFQQGLMELDLGNTATVALLEMKLRKLEGEDATLTLLLEGERFLQEAVDEKDTKILMARDRQQMLVLKRPNWEFTYLLAGDIADKVGNEREVIDALVKAIDAGNRDPMRYRDLIKLYLDTGQTEKAQAALERGVRLYPNLLGLMHFRFRPPYQLFLTDFSRAIRREDAEAARQIARKWLTLAEKNNVDAQQLALFYSFIAQNFFNIDQLSTSEEYFKKAAVNGGLAVLPLARYLATTDKMQEAMQMIYEEMTHSQTPEQYLLPVLALMRDHEYDPAWVEPYDDFVHAVQPSEINDPATLYQYIQYWVIREKNDLTLPWYRRLSVVLPDSTVVMNDLAYTIAFQQTDDETIREENIKEGLLLIDKALNEEKDNFNMIDTQGLMILLQGRPADAVKSFEQAVKKSNRAIIYRLHLAVALLRNKEKDRAKKEFAEIRTILVPQMHLLPERNRNYTEELLEAFPE